MKHLTPEQPSRILASDRRLPQVLLAAALLSGGGLMLPIADAGPLVLDEYGTYWILGPQNPGTMLERSLNYENIPPLSPWLRMQIYRLGGRSEFAFRLPSVLWYLLAIGMTYLLGRDLLSPAIGGFSALILAWMPDVIQEVRIARCYSLNLLLAATAFWLTVRWLKEPHRFRWAMGWAAANAALMWTHYLNAPVIGLELLVLLRIVRFGSAFSSLLMLALLLLAGATLPLVPSVLRMAEWGRHFNFENELDVMQVISPLWWLGLPLGSLVGFWLARRPAAPLMQVPLRQIFWVLFLWGVFPMIIVAILCPGDFASLANPRYRIAFAPPGACFLAACLSNRRTMTAASLGVIVALLAMWSMNERLPWQMKRLGIPRAEEWKTMALTIEREGTAGEPIFVQSGLGESYLVPALYNDTLFMDFVACRLGRFYLKTPHPRYGLPFLWNKSPQMSRFFMELVSQIRSSPTPGLWVAAATDTDLNRHSLIGFQRILAREGYKMQRSHLQTHSILLYYRCSGSAE